MTPHERKLILTDNSLTDKQIAERLGLSPKYLPILRRRLGFRKKRGTKRGTCKSCVEINCSTCGKIFRTIPSDKDRQFCSKECQFLSYEYISKLKIADKSYMQSDSYREKRSNPNTPDYRRFSNRVHKLTEQVYKQHKDEINPNNHVRGVAGITGAYHLDHIIPISKGFELGLKPEEVAAVSNLQMLPWNENVKKGGK